MTTLKSLTKWITTNCGKLIKRWGYQTTLLTTYKLCTSQEATVGAKYGMIKWFEIGKGVGQSCTLSPCLFNFYAEYNHAKWWARETQAGVKIAGGTVNSLRYADDTTLMAESVGELKSCFDEDEWGEWKSILLCLWMDPEICALNKFTRLFLFTFILGWEC